MASNFNDTTPAAPAGAKNVKWQKDGSGNISAYASTLPDVAVDLTAQGANIAATTLLTPASPGLFRISVYIIVSRAASSTSTLPSVTITWTDQDNATGQSVTVTPTDSGNLLTTVHEGTLVVSAAASAIQYATAGFASSGGTSMQYALHMRAEAL